jgi:hypothetical protein
LSEIIYPNVYSSWFTKWLLFTTLIFILPNKEIKTYEKAFMHIISECSKLNITFSPKTVFADFEMGIHLALLKAWPSINLKGYRFHLAQSWWRKIQTIG